MKTVRIYPLPTLRRGYAQRLREARMEASRVSPFVLVLSYEHFTGTNLTGEAPPWRPANRKRTPPEAHPVDGIGSVIYWSLQQS